MPWTDANAHDPGVTLLEVLAYTVTAYGVATLADPRRHRAAGPWRAAGLALAGGTGALALREARRTRARRDGEEEGEPDA